MSERPRQIGREARVVGTGPFAVRTPAGAGTRIPPQFLLSERQEALYTHLADLWRPVYGLAADGAWAAVSYTRAFAAAPCYRKTMDSFSDPGAAGRNEGDNMFTTDLWHFGERHEIDEGWIIRDVSVSDDGARVETYGICWVTRGQPVRISSQGGRDSGHTHIRTSQLPSNAVPAGIA